MRRIQLTPPRRVVRVRFDPHGALWVVLRTYPFLTRWDSTGDGPPTVDWRLPDSTRDMAFAPHNLGLAFGTTAGQVQYRSGSDTTASCTFDIGRTQEFIEQIRPVSAVRFAPATDSKRCWLAMAASQFCLWNPYSQEYIFNPAEGDYRGASFGPDGAFVASLEHHAHTLTAWDVKPFRVRFRFRLIHGDDFANGSVAVLPDGERIVYAAGSGLFCTPMTGTFGWEAPLKKPAIDLALHPNGKSVLIADGSKKVTQLDTENGRTVRQFDWGVGKVSCVDVSADGTLAAAGGEKGQVVVWDGE